MIKLCVCVSHVPVVFDDSGCVGSDGTVCRESYPTTLTPRTVCRFFGHVQSCKHRPVTPRMKTQIGAWGTGDVVHA